MHIDVISRLKEPFVPISKKAKEFVNFDMDESGFVDWIEKEAANDSLIGAGFIWHRGSDNLTVFPLTLEIYPDTKRLIKHYIDTDFNIEYARHPYPHWVKFYMDSVKREINEEVGFSIYNYRYNQEFNTRRGRCEAVRTVFGIVWNYDYYQRELLPQITAEILSDPRKYSLPPKDRLWEYYGMLLTDLHGDTLFSFGKVQIDYDNPLQLKYQFFWEFEHGYLGMERGQSALRKGWRLGWSPGWRLYVHNHEPMNPNEDYMDKVLFSLGDDDSREAIRTWIWNILLRTRGLDSLSWLYLALALGVFFLFILLQIIARNRQRDFIAHVSHELRTPVAKLKLFAETLRHDRAISEEKENEYLDTILGESDHLSVLIDNTLNLTRLDAGRMKIKLIEINLADFLNRFNDNYSSILMESGFEVKLKIEPDLPLIKADPDMLELALRNIVDNAVKYSENRKEVEIKVEKHDKNKIRMIISDRGIGIPSNKRKAIFRRFYRIKPKDREPVGGAGVGLSLVREIVHRHRGRVWCEDRKGGGSWFAIELTS